MRRINFPIESIVVEPQIRNVFGLGISDCDSFIFRVVSSLKQPVPLRQQKERDGKYGSHLQELLYNSSFAI